MNSAVYGMNQYRQMATHAKTLSADPHQLVVLLFEGALEKIANAKGAMVQNQVVEKGQKISGAIAIIDGLRGSLDHNQGGEIAANLDSLYDYMQRCLLKANAENNQQLLDEVASLIKEIRSAWVAIPLEERIVGQA